MSKYQIYQNLLKILEEALKLKEDSIIDFILHNHNILPKDVLKIMIEKGLTYRFNEFIKMYNNKTSLLTCLNKDINGIIKSYLGINYKYINKYIINDYNIFIQFMKNVYIGNDIVPFDESYLIGIKYQPVYYYDCGWNNYLNHSIVFYCLYNKKFEQLKYLLDNNYISPEHIKDLKDRNASMKKTGANYSLISIVGKTKCYDLIKHLL